MSTPEILYLNNLHTAQAGRGDGTIYATATSAVVDQDAKTLTFTGLSIMTDLGADGADKFNGYVARNVASGREYLIVDWTAAVATVFEYPNVTDTTAYEIRRTLYTQDFNVANPIRYGANGQLEKKWIDSGANSTAIITAAAPNLIDDGGFELNSLTDYWTIRGAGGTATVAINPTTPILGTYDCKWNQGDQTYIGIEQAGKGPLRRGYTYGIIIKTGGDGGVVTDFRISIEYVAGATALLPLTWTKINSGDDTATASIWKPAITDANAWDEATFVVDEDVDTGDWKLVLDQYDATDVFGDQIYVWEIGPTGSTGGAADNPDTFIAAGHNFGGGFVEPSYVAGLKTQLDITGYTGSESIVVIDLDADVQVDGNSPIYETFTAPTSIYPIWGMQFVAVSGKTWEAAEIWVGKRWTWDLFLSGDWEPVDQSIEVASSITVGGNKRVSERYEQKLRSGTIATLDDDEVAEWEAFIAEVKRSKPFWYYIAAISDPVLASEIMLMRNRTVPRLPMNADRFRSANYDLEEVL